VIVHDDETIEEALQMLESTGCVRYSDRYNYITIEVPGRLESCSRSAITRNEIAIVVPCGHEHEMENYDANLRRIRERRIEEEKKRVKEWIVEHPEAVEKFKKKL